jgi:hypothetical protein
MRNRGTSASNLDRASFVLVADRGGQTFSQRMGLYGVPGSSEDNLVA